MNAESRVEKPLPMYVPRDERFEESKQNTFTIKRLKAVLHNLIPSLKASLSANNNDFNEFSDVDGLYSEGLLIKFGFQDEVLRKIPLVRKIHESSQGLLKYDTPKIISSEYHPYPSHYQPLCYLLVLSSIPKLIDESLFRDFNLFFLLLIKIGILHMTIKCI